MSKLSLAQEALCNAHQIFSIKQTNNICRIDAKQLSEHGDKFLSANSELYYIACNSWILYLEDLSRVVQPEIRSWLLTNGLVAAIKVATALSSALIEDTPFDHSPFIQFCDDINGIRVPGFDALRYCLLGLRFLKRFSPAKTDVLFQKGILDLLSMNNRCKQIDRRNESKVIIDLKAIVHTMLKKEVRVSHNHVAVPGGATFDKDATLAEKLISAERRNPLLLYPLSPNWTPVYNTARCPFSLFYSKERRYSAVTAVEKSYKAVRIIAKELSLTQIEQQPLVDALLKSCLHDRTYHASTQLLIHDQGRNRELARLGSIDGCVATVDLSSASDTIPVGLVKSVFPKWVTTQYEDLRATHMLVSDKPVTTYISSTMGARITFPIETILFYAITILSVEYLCAYESVPNKRRQELLSLVSAYGDDIIVPADAYDYLLHILDSLGMIVNKEKSYSGEELLYRESCGVEYINGFDLSQEYFPRKTFPKGDVERLQFLIPLQHKLCGYRVTNAFLVDVIKTVNPSITESFMGSVYTDLWSRYPQVRTVRYDKNRIGGPYNVDSDTQNYYEYEYHTTFITSYTSIKDPHLWDAYQRYAYYTFLVSGPYYKEPIDSLLGVSTRRIEPDAFTGKGSQKCIVKLYS